MVDYDTPITDLPGFGEKTAKDLRRTLHAGRDKYGDVTVSELERAGSREGGVLDVKLNKTQKQTLNKQTSLFFREAQERQEKDVDKESLFKPVGDFKVNRGKRQEAWEAHQDRPAFNQEMDEERRARITTDFDKWESDMDSFDFPGIDTPGRKPRAQEKDRPFVDEEEEILRDVFD